MPFVLVRVDDRMIHGQVVVGWGNAIHPDRIILCNDDISSNSWEKELYECSFSDPDCKINVYSIEELLQYWNGSFFADERCILLFETPKDAYKVYEQGIRFDHLNIGGLHYRDAKKELNNYIYVDSEDIHYLTQLQDQGVKIEGQDVPNAKKVNVRDLIDKIS